MNRAVIQAGSCCLPILTFEPAHTGAGTGRQSSTRRTARSRSSCGYRTLRSATTPSSSRAGVSGLAGAVQGAFVEGGGDEGGAHQVGADAFGAGDAGLAGEAAQLGVDAAVGVAAGAVAVEENRPAGALADQRVEGADRRRGQHDGGDLAALA